MKQFVLVVLGVFFFTALAWSTLFIYGQSLRHPAQPQPFFKKKFEVIAHRGGSFEAPENTMAAFSNGASISPDVIFELDVHFTKDQQIVVIHDDTVDRTTNGHGFVKDFTLEELQKLDAGYNFDYDEEGNRTGNFSWRGKGVKIPLLSDLFDKFPNQRMLVETKPSSSELARALFLLIKKYDRLDKTVFTSEHGDIIRYQRSFGEPILTAAPRDEVLRSVMLASIGLEALDKMPADMYCIPEKQDGIQVFSQTLLEEANKRNKKVFIWTIDNTSDMKRLIDENVNGIITDRPKALESLANSIK
jgi:glycerophosphoryl diester phosphodiesterase